MSVLSRWGRTRADVGAVCFISRNLLPEDASGLFNRIDGLHDDLDVPLLVVPCDEQGVCAARLGDLDGVRGLPVYFLGVRPWLRRRIAERYGLVLQTEHPRLGALRAEVERADLVRPRQSSRGAAPLPRGDVSARRSVSDRVLARRTAPYPQKLARAHSPTVKTYENFKDCLRWEFGFTCAICLLHERDVVLPGTGAGRTGQFSVEHKVLKSTPAGKAREDDYSNCLYLCRFCNTCRGDRYPDVTPEARLLDPVTDRWDKHFVIAGDALDAVENDPDAAYTEAAYGVNDGNRSERRRARAALIDGLRGRLEARVRDIESIDGELSQALTEEARHRKLTQRGRWRDELTDILNTLRDFLGVPRDAPTRCRCSSPRTLVPAVIEAGWEKLPVVDVREAPGARERRFRS